MHLVYNCQYVVNFDNVMMKKFIIFINYHLMHLEFETLQFKYLKEQRSPQSCSLTIVQVEFHALVQNLNSTKYFSTCCPNSYRSTVSLSTKIKGYVSIFVLP